MYKVLLDYKKTPNLALGCFLEKIKVYLGSLIWGSWVECRGTGNEENGWFFSQYKVKYQLNSTGIYPVVLRNIQLSNWWDS